MKKKKKRKKTTVMKINKSIIYFLLTVSIAFTGCEDENRTLMSNDTPGDYDIQYGLFHVYQYDEVNINGIDIASKLDFFDSFRLTLHYTDNRISGVTFDNGEVPFLPFGYEIPEGRQEAYLNTDAVPNELRLKGSETVVAYFEKGEFIIPFQLDCSALSYKYTFKSINQ